CCIIQLARKQMLIAEPFNIALHMAKTTHCITDAPHLGCAGSHTLLGSRICEKHPCFTRHSGVVRLCTLSSGEAAPARYATPRGSCAGLSCRSEQLECHALSACPSQHRAGDLVNPLRTVVTQC